MVDPEDRIKSLEKQIAFLTAELQRTREKSDSLWYRIYDVFAEDNSTETAEVYAEDISRLVVSWANSQREKVLRVVMETGSMPHYTDCLNDLARSVSPPGQQPPELNIPVPEGKEEAAPVPTPLDDPNDPSSHMKPKKRVVNVPKPIPGAVPLALALDPEPS